jgi:dynein heavy chain 2
MQFLGADDLSWAGMKRFLGNAGIINQILGFDARQVTPSMKSKVGKIIAQYPASFEPSVIKRSSVACAPLAAWSIANLKYSEILLKIEPLTSELDKLSAKLAQSTERVAECRVQLQQLEEATQELNNEFQKKTSEAARLEADLQKTEEVLHAAQKLLGQLSGENERWKV